MTRSNVTAIHRRTTSYAPFGCSHHRSPTGRRRTAATLVGLATLLAATLIPGPNVAHAAFTFQEGINGYSGAHDTYLRQSEPFTISGDREKFEWDSSSKGGANIGLLRFDNIFGSGGGQIPPGVAITSATLTIVLYNATSAPAADLRHSLVDWNEANTHWNNFGGDAGVQANEVGPVVASAPLPVGTWDIDVTSSLQTWSNDPASNHGWVFMPNSSNGAKVRSSDRDETWERPILTVDFSGCSSDSQCDDGIPCNGSERCVSGTCVAGVPLNCDDGLPCTDDFCEVTGCVHADNCAQQQSCDPLTAQCVSVPTTNFTIVHLPDTQFYALAGSPIFATQTQWIVDNMDEYNVEYVAHSGDCVENADLGSEWQLADVAMSNLENSGTTGLADGIPYGVAVGNHDQFPKDEPGTLFDQGSTTTQFNQWFGAPRFEGRGYYGSHYGINNDNHYDLFSAAGLHFITVYMEFMPDDTTLRQSVLDWADQLLTDFPSRRAIVVSHYLLHDDEQATFTDQGQATYDVLKHHSNLFLMLTAHSSGEARRSDTFGGNTVHSLLANYQSRDNGGDGWLRMLEFAPFADEIRVRTYSPSLGQWESDDNSEFVLAYDMPGLCSSDAECDDRLGCNGVETCALGTCQPGTPIVCNDGVACTDDICDNDTASCVSIPVDALCGDGTFCNGSEICSPGTGCGGGVDPCPGQQCNENTNTCIECSVNGDCNDGQFCNGAEICSAQQTCTSGSAPCGGQYCDESSNSCEECVIDAHCDDGQFCNGTESCSGAGSCQSGTSVNCSDGIACTSDSCDEGSDSCTHTTNNAACNNGVFCDGAETCDAFLGCQSGGDPCSGFPCDEGADQCELPDGLRMEAFTATVGATPVTIATQEAYLSPVVVCSSHYTGSARPAVPRVSSVTSTSFDIRLHNPSNASVVDRLVSCLVVEEGTWTIDGVRVEAQKYSSTVTDSDGSWSGQSRSYGHGYSNPVVVGQVMTENDGDWSVFWCQGDSRLDPPSAGSLRTGKTVCEDSDTTRANETVGFIVIEAGHHVIAGVEIEAGLTSDTIEGVDNSPPYSYSFDTAFAAAPEVVVTTLAGMDGVNGGWSQTHGPVAADASRLYLSVDEDQIGDSERSHTTEQVGYVAVAAPFSHPGLTGCQVDSDCNDGVACTTDSCNQGSGTCSNLPQSALCNDGFFCNGVEVCSTQTGCNAGADPCPGQSCDEGANICVACTADADCLDGNPCTVDRCDASNTCQHDVVCEPGNITFEEARNGGSTASNTVSTSLPVTGAQGHVYLAALSTRKMATATSVSGLGLSWTRLDHQCGGRGQTAVELWMAQGSPTASGIVTATYPAPVNSAVIAVTRYSGVSDVNPLGNVASANSNGVSGGCSGGVDGSSYSFTLQTTAGDAVVHVATAMRNRSHNAGGGYTERVEIHSGSGGQHSSTAGSDTTVASPGPTSVNGSFNSTVDWAAIAVELRP